MTRSALSPHRPRRLYDHLELPPLIIRAEQIADHVGGKAALRRDGELVEGQKFARLVDPSPQRVDGFELRHFGADEAEHHHPALRHETQRRKAAGAWRVVFEQET